MLISLDHLATHPINNQYESQVTFKYPDSPGFPQYLSMVQSLIPALIPINTQFVYPTELSFEYVEDDKPSPKWHSFVITEENGKRLYGVCVTVFEKIDDKHRDEFNAMVDAWRDNSVVRSCIVGLLLKLL